MSEIILGSGATYENSLLFQLIETNNVRNYVVSRNAQFQELANIFETIGGKQAVPVRSGARVIKLPYLPKLSAYAVIANGGRTVVGTTLKLTFQDSTYDGFINDRALQSSNGTFGKVVAHAAGYVVIILIYSVTGDITFQAADFAAGTQVSEGQDISKGVTGSKETKLYTPLIQDNVIGAQRYTLELTRENVSRRTVVEVNGQPYWQHAAQPLFMKETKNSINKGIWQNPKVATPNQWMSGGVKWQIENQGGQHELYQGVFDQSMLIRIAKNAKARGLNTTEYVVPCGYNVLSGFQENVASKYITYAGNTNTIGGKEIKGINARQFDCLDISFKFVSFSMLNDMAVNPEGVSSITGELKSSYTAAFIDTSPVDTQDYGTQPFVSAYSYGEDAYYMQKIEGMTDIMGKKSKNPVNAINAANIEIEVNEYWQLNDGSRHLLLEIEA